VVDWPGDNILAEFPTALDAVQGAVEVQRVIRARNADLPAERRMEFRIGVHMGDVSVEGDRLYGDGVNIAARLEGLAQPGSICVSRTVQEQVLHKLDLTYDDLGEQEVKNIPEPVRAYHIDVTAGEPLAVTRSRPGRRTAVTAAALVVFGLGGYLLWRLAAAPSPEAASAEEFLVPGFGDVPAIAVLPFDNLSGDPEQEYFADGIAEDLISRLSAWRSLPVIARNSSFTYKGKAVDVKQVSRELGVRYVVEGSVRRGGDQVRISAQLIDATTGSHVWARTYDRELRDIFEIQDEITEAIAGSVIPALLASEAERAIRKEPQNLDAYDYRMRALWHLSKFTKEDNRKARVLLEQAIGLDPEDPETFANLAIAHYIDNLRQWTDSPARSLAEQFAAAQKCLKLDSARGDCHGALAWAYSLSGQRDQAIASAELAVELEPGNPLAHQRLGLWLAVTGNPDEGIAHQQRAIRLSPRSPFTSYYMHCISLGHFASGRYEEAVEWEQRALQRTPDYWVSLGTLASSYAHLARMKEARSTLEEMLRNNPEYSEGAFRMIFSIADAAFIESWLSGIRKAGFKG
jgi:adenylate cyclase